MTIINSYIVTVLLDVNITQDVDDRADSRSYMVADRASGEAAIIDAVIENVERELGLIAELRLTLFLPSKDMFTPITSVGPLHRSYMAAVPKARSPAWIGFYSRTRPAGSAGRH